MFYFKNKFIRLKRKNNLKSKKNINKTTYINQTKLVVVMISLLIIIITLIIIVIATQTEAPNNPPTNSVEIPDIPLLNLELPSDKVVDTLKDKTGKKMSEWGTYLKMIDCKVKSLRTLEKNNGWSMDKDQKTELNNTISNAVSLYNAIILILNEKQEDSYSVIKETYFPELDKLSQEYDTYLNNPNFTLKSCKE